jgi:acyl-CoA synthetase (AMP-forming)/AMP-acid ligase II
MIRIADFITKAAFQGPERPAVSFGDLTLTWAQLEHRCWSAAGAFRKLGIGTGDRIAYLGHNSHRQFEAYVWPTRVGAILVPLNYRLSIAELIECVADCMPKVLVVDRHFVTEARAIADACSCIKTLVFADDTAVPEGMGGYEQLLEAAADTEPETLEPFASQDSDTIILFYTSGSRSIGRRMTCFYCPDRCFTWAPAHACSRR